MTASVAAGVALGTGRSTAATCCPIVELRQYTLKPGRRDDLIDLFEREFVETQEALGISLIGQFRDLDKPDRFVWLRGFPDMPSRASALTAFYTGPAWKAHRDAANDTMIDSDNVLLLHPARANAGFVLDGPRPPFAARRNGAGIVVATIYSFATPVGGAFLTLFERDIAPAAGVPIRATLATEASPNTFPALPVRENENVFVWFATFASLEAYQAHLRKLEHAPQWQEASSRLRAQLKSDPETLRLAPASRSLLHG